MSSANDQEKGTHQPILLEWSNLEYVVKVPPQNPSFKDRLRNCCSKKNYDKKTILSDVSGYVKPGETLAIIGPSGSGKTTLLNVLARLIPQGKWKGTVTANGQQLNRGAFKELAAYLPQFDILVGSQTVYEALHFQVKLKQHKLSDLEIDTKVLDTLDELGLMKVKDSLIGYVGEDATNSGLQRGISGGERKRLSLGLELMSSPSLLFLDEPTTGLDSFAAESVIRTLYNQARLGRTVTFTIHQPSSDIMDLFDKLLIMTSGRVAYFGPVKEAFKYFASINCPVPIDENPCEFFLDVVHMDPAAKHEAASSFATVKERSSKLGEQFKSSKWGGNVTIPDSERPKNTTDLVLNKKSKAPFYTMLWQLLLRSGKHMLREPVLLQSQFAMALFLGILFGVIFLDLDHDQASISNRAGALFLGCTAMMFTSMIGPFTLFAVDRKIFLFQTRAGLYDTTSYYISKAVVEIPGFFLRTIMFTIIIYFMWDLDLTFYKIFIFWLIQFCLANVSWAFSSMIVGIFPNPAVAINLFPLMVIPLMLFAGFYLNSDNTPPYFIWVEYISFMKYAFRCVARNEFSGQTFYCTDQERAASGGVCQFLTGEEWLKFRLLDDMPIWGDIGVLIGMWVGCHTAALFLMKRLQANSKQ
eukprot:TRINITY_DN5431_c0_g1_i1.p1 TRINITY_DN5431_c0_g1~~TRINITY_DN5431_c0_g1_i1.p1  ORF type:complete len:641 (-),score=112.28 TRINITY_DN5431_c0_g1_i1:49-1971(-)